MLSRRDFLKLAGTTLIAAAFPRLDFLEIVPAFGPVIYHGSRVFPRIAMTFDDCYHTEVIEQLVALLQPYPGFHFTFFPVGDAILIGEAIKPGIWKMLVQAGHELGYHTMHHVDPFVMSTQSLVNDFDQWMETLHGVLGFGPNIHFARPPGDDLTSSWQELCQRRGLVATMFSTGFEAPTMIDSMLLASRAVNGDIVQMHTYLDPARGRFDLDIAAKTVPYLVERGFSLITMSQLYADLLREQTSSEGCSIGIGNSLTRTCLNP